MLCFVFRFFTKLCVHVSLGEWFSSLVILCIGVRRVLIILESRVLVVGVIGYICVVITVSRWCIIIVICLSGLKCVWWVGILEWLSRLESVLWCVVERYSVLGVGLYGVSVISRVTWVPKVVI